MSDLAEREPLVPPLLRDRSGVQRVTNIELFFDLVYVFAVTQLSHFDQSAGAAAEMIARSDDPGRLGRSAYHLIHPVMVAGIIVCAAADEKVLADPGAAASAASAWMILGGPALFLAGHATFKLVVWRAVSWLRLAGIAVLGLLALAAHAIPTLALAACAAVLVVAVAASDRLPWLPRPAEPAH
jgi:low temperature requirement protein LtrA